MEPCRAELHTQDPWDTGACSYQVEILGDIGDILEDDLEHLHRISKKIEDRTCRIKNIAQQALSHSHMEAKFNNKDIIEKTRESKLSSKRVYKKARTGSIE